MSVCNMWVATVCGIFARGIRGIHNQQFEAQRHLIGRAASEGCRFLGSLDRVYTYVYTMFYEINIFDGKSIYVS